jgi:ABC-2 type transport system ATP-binding protein
MARDAAIAIDGLTKHFGEVIALDGLELDVHAGEVTGFLGPNGAGKSTTIRLLLDLIRPDAGSAAILGRDCQADGVRARAFTGYLPGDVRLYESWTGHEIARHAAGLRGHGTSHADAEEIALRLGLNLGRKVRTLSKGNRQKLGLVIALMHRPPVLILDEPTSGLDPIRQRAAWEILRERAADGVAVLFSSHIMSEIEEVCDRVAVLRSGRLLAVDTVSGLIGTRPTCFRLTFAGPAPDLTSIPGVTSVRTLGHELTCDFAGEPSALIQALAGRQVLSLAAQPPRLEQAVIDLYEAA